METTLTVKQAAEALGISPRTLRRRLQAGDLSYTRTLRGNREVLTVDAAELARFAQVHDYALRQPGTAVVATEGTEGQTVTNGGKLGGTEGQEVAPAPKGTEGIWWQTVATEGKRGHMGANGGALEGTEGQTVATEGTPGADRIGALEARLQEAGAAIASLQAQAQALTQERDFLRQVVLNLTTKALPAAAEERRPSWWQRLWGQGEGK